MRLLRSTLILLALATFAACPALGAPPQVIILPTGETTIKSGANVVTLKADGSISIKGPLVDLALPGNETVPPVPPVDPANPDAQADKLAERIGVLFGSHIDPQKTAKTKELASIWRKAIPLVDGCETLGEINTQIKALQTLKDDDLLSMREAIRDEITSSLGNSAKTKIDKAKARACFARIVNALEKAVSE